MVSALVSALVLALVLAPALGLGLGLALAPAPALVLALVLGLVWAQSRRTRAHLARSSRLRRRRSFEPSTHPQRHNTCRPVYTNMHTNDTSQPPTRTTLEPQAFYRLKTVVLRQQAAIVALQAELSYLGLDPTLPHYYLDERDFSVGVMLAPPLQSPPQSPRATPDPMEPAATGEAEEPQMSCR